VNANRGRHIETISSRLKGSDTEYFIPPPIDAQLGRIPIVHASAIVTNHLNIRKIVLKILLRSGG
jgi:hypothetical protein